jgi:methylthioribose-1-phosphate isomerase
MSEYDSVRPVEWAGDCLRLIDQRRLPGELVHLECRRVGEVTAAIRDMVVRGAPAIGIAAAYGVVLAVREFARGGGELERALERLEAARPTAVNLHWALARMRRALARDADDSSVLAEARAIHDADVAANRRMGELGAARLPEGRAVLTHCNTGSLATGGFGTALGVVRSGWRDGRVSGVYADETRPWLQGSRLTAWELIQDGIPVRVIADGAAAALLRTGEIGCVVVGADRVTANGDVANKIGTYGLALAARAHGVPFMVVAPTSTLDPDTPNGSAITIEQRNPEEVLGFGPTRVAPDGADAWNPVFDITPAALVDVLVTEAGVLERPDGPGVASLLQR